MAYCSSSSQDKLYACYDCVGREQNQNLSGLKVPLSWCSTISPPSNGTTSANGTTDGGPEVTPTGENNTTGENKVNR